jgi:hypothetical protein
MVNEELDMDSDDEVDSEIEKCAHLGRESI